ncbi:MAG: redoxin domain-containing protein [Planctomycetota bacterium]|nr:redoxin domain-containing protein [Planctomycetota bacterium]
MICLIASACLLTSVSSGSAQEPARTTLAQEFAQLQGDYLPVSGGLRGATTDLERSAAVELLATYPRKFVDLAERCRDDPIVLAVVRDAIQALSSTDSAAQIVWETNESGAPSGCLDDTADRIVALLARGHLQSEGLGPVIDRMRHAYRLEFAGFLDTLLERSPHHHVRGLACLSLAQSLNDRQRALRLLEDRPELAACYELVFGKDYLPELQELGGPALAQRIESLLERAARDFGDVELGPGTVAARAQSELHELRHLGIGKVAPDMQGVDQEGAPIKLSDQRGKVVLLYFWSEY